MSFSLPSDTKYYFDAFESVSVRVIRPDGELISSTEDVERPRCNDFKHTNSHTTSTFHNQAGKSVS